MDRQHQKLLTIVGLVIGQLDGKATGLSLEVQGALAALQDCNKVHLYEEEELLNRYGYPRLEEAKRRHHEAIITFSNIITGFIENEFDSFKFIDLLQLWIITHIKNEDSIYSEFILNQQRGEH